MKKRLLLAAAVLLCWSCGQNSSPEGRMTMKVEDLQRQLDSLKSQNAAILDSLGKIKEVLQAQRK
ncbi:hypothetical protein AAE02nite_12610 [Adhaeribacter aerolatus]|uniref:Uncharacterized protein n=1 Tax=Adhaeribacter aerolatus TaxID=670289 RepID=A0A512AVL1_9BACT|nr:hypothetical protein [Adhaeribacter aerolatus]GEO03597.1 hypothetical protein AAE02nite_12610 [Adhaeribacter aerolatus]